ncbi:glycosyltransferase family 39 protein [Cyanobacterium stanieri LEGE 03274]|uniref:Glycosyltransferase family 39 protein n=1 Tax=Cyanobacterium stanieri LEGE 03274 TaxID=1828756 RepID=A0ABR9V751_9CHRO|nr:glycosyltransferase family 39 protein [Cyanobacterium stanieri]MBE9223359.1 glycosyltransferase family 39 protein [Cyanobacterium stanieri LEGE 03274]
MTISKKNPNIQTQVYIILIIGLIIRAVIAFFLNPGYDEAYYYLYTKNLDWSYFDHPPLVAITTGIGIWITGIVNQFTIRIGSLILHTGSLYLLYLTGKKMYNQWAGLFALIIASLIPIFQIAFGILTLPDAPLIFFWTLTLYVASEEFFDFDWQYKPSYRVAIIGVLVGLACLSKYHGFVLGLGLVAFCLSSKPYRRIFFSPWLWLSLGLFLLTLFPLWYWNWQNGWVSFGFQLSGRFDSGEGMEVNFLNLILFFLAGVGYLFPSFGFPLWWITIRSFLIEVFSRPHYPSRLILWVSLPMVIGFTLLGALTQILPTWAMPGFWGLTIMFGHYVCAWNREFPRKIRQWLSFSGIMIYSLLGVVLFHATTGVLQNPSPFLPMGILAPEDDPSTELVDVVRLGSQFNTSVEFRRALMDSDFVFTNAYYLGGYIAMGLAQNEDMVNMPVSCISDDVRGFGFWQPLEDLMGEDGLYVTVEAFGKDEVLLDEFGGYFDSFDFVTEIPLERGGVVVEVFYVYEGKNFSFDEGIAN